MNKFKNLIKRSRQKAKGRYARMLQKKATSADTPLPKNHDAEMRNIKRSRSVKRSIVRAILLVSLVSLAVGFISVVSLSLYLNQGRATNILKEIVEHQTGGRFEFEWHRYSFTTGFELKDIQLFPPTTAKSFLSGGSVSEKPLIAIERINIDYSLLALYLLKLEISELTASSVKIDIRSDQLKGLVAYRHKTFPKDETPQKNTSLEDLLDKNLVPNWLPVLMNNLYSPISFSAGNMGLNNVSIVAENLEISDISIKSSLVASGSKNRFIITVVSPDSGSMLKLGESRIHLLPDIEIGVTNIKNISVKINTLVKFLDVDGKPRIPIKTLLSARVEEDLQGINVEKMAISLGDFFKTSLVARILMPENNLRKVSINVENSVEFSVTDRLRSIAERMSGITFEGSLKQSCNIDGDVKILKDNTPVLPISDCKVFLKGLGLSKDEQFSLKSLSGDANVVIRSSQASSGYVIEPEMDIQAKAFKLNAGNLNIRLKDISTSLTSRLKLIEGELSPRSYIDFDIGKIALSKDDEKIFEDSFSTRVQTRGLASTGGYDLSIDSELETLLKASSKITCDRLCKRIEFNGLVSLVDLTKLAQSITMLLPKDVRSKVPGIGRGDLNLSYSGSLKRPKDNSKLNFNRPELIAKLIEQKIEVETNGSLSDVTSIQPTAKIKTIEFSVDTGISKDGFSLAAKSHIKDAEHSGLGSVSKVGGIDVNFESDTRTQHSLDISNIVSEMNSKISLSNVTHTSKGQLVAEVNVLSLGYDVELSGIRRAKLKSFELKADNSLKAKVSGAVSLSEDLSIEKASFEGTTNGDVRELATYVSGSNGAGNFANSWGVEVNKFGDFKFTTIQKFRGINFLYINNAKPLSLALKGFSGSLPFEYSGNFFNLKKLVEESKKEKEQSLNELATQYLKDKAKVEAISSDNERSLSRSSLKSVTNADPIYIESAKFNSFEVSNLSASVSMSESGFFVDNYEFESLGGVASGSLFVSMSPLPTRIAANMHLSGLNTEQIPYRMRGDSIPKDIDVSPFSMTSHIDYTISDRNINGEVNVTEIGKTQAGYFLDVLDPENRDENINAARLGLKVGYPKGMNIPIRSGKMDLNFDIRTLGLPIPLPGVRGFPLIGLIENIKSDLDISR